MLKLKIDNLSPIIIFLLRKNKGDDNVIKRGGSSMKKRETFRKRKRERGIKKEAYQYLDGYLYRSGCYQQQKERKK